MTSTFTNEPVFRKTRFVCVSDTHNQTPKLPAGDVLIHAGDLTNQGSQSELAKTIAWLAKADFECKIVVAGNHDCSLDTLFYQEHGSYIHNQNPQDPTACQELLKTSSTITYLQHETREIYLRDSKGPQTSFSVFGSPYSPAQGNWAFQYDKNKAKTIWDDIPLNTDIVVTHAPPNNHCDYSASGRSQGCEALRKALWRVRPMLSVCGHTHEGRGVERVRWKLDLPLCPYLEERSKFWEDPGAGTNKLSLVDLTQKGGERLENHYDSKYQPQLSPNKVSFSPPTGDVPSPRTKRKFRISRSRRRSRTASRSRSRSKSRAREASANSENRTARLTKEQEEMQELAELEKWHSRLDGLNVAALTGRMERKETCVVNAAITGTSWGQGPKRFNKPIVVDLELPVWDGASNGISTMQGNNTMSSDIS